METNKQSKHGVWVHWPPGEVYCSMLGHITGAVSWEQLGSHQICVWKWAVPGELRRASPPCPGQGRTAAPRGSFLSLQPGRQGGFCHLLSQNSPSPPMSPTDMQVWTSFRGSQETRVWHLVTHELSVQHQGCGDCTDGQMFSLPATNYLPKALFMISFLASSHSQCLLGKGFKQGSKLSSWHSWVAGLALVMYFRK